ncbi:hypothetical protein ACJ41O_003579 [Fusarium nematophilum]
MEAKMRKQTRKVYESYSGPERAQQDYALTRAGRPDCCCLKHLFAYKEAEFLCYDFRLFGDSRPASQPSIPSTLNKIVLTQRPLAKDGNYLKLLSTITAIAAVVLCTNAAAIEDVSNAAVAEAEGFSSVPSLLEARQDPLPTFNEWTCAKPFGGPGHSGLKKIHAGFNRVFGKNALVVASGQCYVANCHNLFFALCNTSGITRKEGSGHRDHARNSNPEKGSSCRYLRYRNTYMHYYYGTGNGSLGGKVDRRRC